MDKLAAANRINEFLQSVVTNGGLHLKYRIVVDPPAPTDWEKPEIFVDFTGPDSTLLLDRGGELLRALELLAFEILHLPSAEHEKCRRASAASSTSCCATKPTCALKATGKASTAAWSSTRQTITPLPAGPRGARSRSSRHLMIPCHPETRVLCGSKSLP